MTTWNGKAVLFLMIAGQVVTGMLSGRAIYLAHCGDHGPAHHDDHVPDDGNCGAGEGCLALLEHNHPQDLGHDHGCRCPHFHVRNEMQRDERARELLRGPITASVLKSFQPAPATLLPPRCATRGPLMACHASPPQTALAIAATRLLV